MSDEERKPWHSRKLGLALCEALGIDPAYVHRIVLDCDIANAAMVTVYGCALVESPAGFTKEMRETFQQYKLEPVEELVETTAFPSENKTWAKSAS